MEITARELLDVEIREAFRGYHRDDVNDLLERAASTIEALSDRVRQFGERAASAEGGAGRVRETEDILHRTLLLAQRAADEAVAEAQAQARQMVEEADAQARRILADAESELRRRGEVERRRLEDEILELSGRRDALLADVEKLGRHESDYRERIVQTLEADLAMLRSRPTASPGPLPEMHEIEVPSAPESVMRTNGELPVADEATRSFESLGLDPISRPLVGSGVGGDTGNIPVVEAPSPAEAPIAEAPAAEAPGVLAAEVSAVATPLEIDLHGEEQALEAEVLDDDAFFATLREAVSDEAPLGPREGGEATFFDQDATNPGSFKELFKRRR